MADFIIGEDIEDSLTSEIEVELKECNAGLVKALSAAGITSLTPVQKECLPHGLAGKDLLAKAKTGTGKTLGFLIPAVEQLMRLKACNTAEVVDGHDPVNIIILSSTRELANQITTQAKMVASALGLNVDCILGGTAINPQKERLDPTIKGQFKYGGVVDIMIATPGRLMEHIDSTSGFVERIGQCKILVLDEVDQLLETGFQKNIEFIISKLPTTRQTMCFSATVPARLKNTLGLALKEDHVVIDCVGEADVDTHDRILQSYIVHPLEQTLLALYLTITKEMEAHPDSYKILVFLPTARNAQFYCAVLNELELGIEVMEIHSRRNQQQRTATANAYREAKRAVLLSSDISARGVDYPMVTLIIQLGPPSSKEVYVQRLGRTGRADQAGAGILLLCSFERPFLSQLKDLPLQDRSKLFAKDAASEDSKVIFETKIQTAAARVDEDLVKQTYLAWLKAFNGTLRKLFKWSKQDLVDHANLFGRSVLCRPDPIMVPIDQMIMMGLKDCSGLNQVDASIFGGFDSEQSLFSLADSVQEDVWLLKPVMKIINPTFRKDGKAVFDALSALDSATVVALQAELEAVGSGGSVMVAGFAITADMVTIAKKETPSRGPSRATSLASMVSLTPASSSSNLAGCASMSSMSRASSFATMDGAGISKTASEASLSVLVKPTEQEMADANERVKAAGQAMRSLTDGTHPDIIAGKEKGAVEKEAQTELTAAKLALKNMKKGKK